MPHIETLIDDIYKMLDGKVDVDSEEADKLLEEFAHSIKEEVKSSLKNDREPRLSMSNFATPDRKLWYAINKPEEAEPLTPNTRIKFVMGHMAEALVILLAQLAGHKVEGQQDRMYVGELYGHRDCVIDGSVVDVKSANSRSFTKFSRGTLVDDDPFGYMDQLSLYHHASVDDPLVTNKSSAHFLAIDKELGHLALLEIQPKKKDYEAEYKRKMKMLESKVPPPRCYPDEEDGKSGNRKLCTQCNYCNHNKVCWPHTRTFIYSNGPRHLTKVVRLPDVREIK